MSDVNTQDDWEKEIEEARNVAQEEDFIETPEPVLPEIPVFETKPHETGFDEVGPELIKPPTTEKKAEETSDKAIADLSGKIYMTSGDIKKLAEVLNQIEVTPESAEQLLNDDANKLLGLTIAVSMNTARSRYQYEQLKKVSENLVAADTFTDDNGNAFANKRSKGASFDKVKNVTGQAAVINTMARLNPFEKIYLPHSGFHIVLRNLEAIEIKNILDSVDEQQREVGRSLGGYYFLLDDLFFLQKTAELLKASVIDSNLQDWQEDNRLLQAINITDHDTILAGYCSAMYKKGVKYKFLCPELSCNYSETKLTDFNKFKRIDYTRFPKEALEILFSPDEFTRERYLKYQELIGAKKVINVDETKKLHLKVPSIFTFLKFGSVIVSAIINQLYTQTKHSPEVQLKDLRNIYYWKNFISWIEKLVFLKETPDEDGNIIDFETTEPDAIDKVLESNIWEDNPNRQSLLDFFSEAKVVHFAYLGDTCPSCGKTPDPDTNGLIPIDVSDFFFNLCLYRLRRGRG